MQSSRHEWNKRTLTADEVYEISLGDLLFATPSALLHAEISINVTYTAWLLLYHLAKSFTSTLGGKKTRKSNGYTKRWSRDVGAR
jgi:hypothetical protein